MRFYSAICLPAAVAALLLVAAFSACRRPENRNLSPYGWSCTDPNFDSLTVLAERTWFDGGEQFGDRRMYPVVDSMMRMASADNATDVIRSRAHYWKARVALRDRNRPLALRELSLADSLCDSVAYPYDKVRIDWTGEDDSQPLSAELCRRLMSQSEVLRASGDLIYAGGRYMELGSLMISIGNYDTGRRYLAVADSLTSLAGQHDIAIYNRINIANSYFYQRDTVRCEKILRPLLDDPAVKSNPIVLDVVLGNLYSETNDTAALRRAYRLALSNPGFEREQCYYESFLADEFARRNMLDSALYYHNLAARHDSLIDNREFREDYFKMVSNVEELRGNYAASLLALRQSMNLADSIVLETERDEIIGIELAQTLAREEMQAQLAARKRTTTRIFVVALLVVVLTFTGWFVNVRLQARRNRELETRLQLEQSHRKVMALQLAMQENDAIHDRLKVKIEELSAENRIDPDLLSSLYEALRNETMTKREQENFMTTFAEIRPDFVDNFRTRYPDATDAECRLAIYIALGLDSKHIARLAQIRPESVKQARWRLRRRMKLPESVTLEQAIADI